MKKYILALESSCDETACAIVDLDGKLLANIVSSQISTHTKYGGVMPEIASRLHISNINYVIKDALNEAHINNEEIAAICVTSGPGLIGALHVGLVAAKTLVLTLNIPLIGVHHLVGHIYSNTFNADLSYPALAIVVSGGHSEFVYMEKEYDFKIIGQTLDDAIGEAYDKVARIIGLGYPGGPKIDKASKEGLANIKMPHPHTKNPYDLSYSGLKTYVNNYVNNAKNRKVEVNIYDICASFQRAAIDMIIEKTDLILKDYKVKQVVVAGGVAANSYLRDQIDKLIREKYQDIELVLPPLWATGDNAAMIARAGLVLYKNGKFNDLSLAANPSWSILEVNNNER